MARKLTYTEEQWRADSSAESLLEHLRAVRGLNRLKGGKRRLRLLGCGAGRLIWHLLPDDRYRQAIEMAEKAAEAEVRHAVMVAARDKAQGRQPETVSEYFTFAFQSFASQFGWSFPDHAKHQWATRLAQAVGAPGGGLSYALVALSATRNLCGDFQVAQADHVRLVRCLFGNPFRMVPFANEWRTPDVLALAQSAYDEGEKGCLPILADALQDAGCIDEEALAHLRSEPRHTRGCWVVDAVLGRLIEWPAHRLGPV